MMAAQSAHRRFALGLAFACFVAQGIANGMLGVAWPSMRETFGLPLDTLVVLLVSSTTGYVIGSIFAGRIMARTGIGRFLLFANVLAAVGLLGYAIALRWWVLVAFGLLSGWASGSIGVSLNIYVASTYTVRIMNWMHGTYGIGATIGPLVMTAVLGSRFGWRLGYLVAAIIHLLLAILFIFVANQLNFRGMPERPATAGGQSTRPAGALATLRMPIIWLGILLFLLYTGVETTTGQWSYSLFTEERSISPYLAGILSSVFWGMLTVGRIVFGAVANRIGATRLLRWSMAGTVFSAGLFIVPTAVSGFAAVAFMGLSLAAIFPTLMADTPNRVGYQNAATAIGFQMGAASVGLAVLPGLAGILAARFGLEVLGPYLLVASSLMLIINELAIRRARGNRLREELEPAA